MGKTPWNATHSVQWEKAVPAAKNRRSRREIRPGKRGFPDRTDLDCCAYFKRVFWARQRPGKRNFSMEETVEDFFDLTTQTFAFFYLES